MVMSVMLRTSVDSSMFGLQSGCGVAASLSAPGEHARRHADPVAPADSVAAGHFPFAIQHLLGIDAAAAHHYRRLSPHQQPQLTSPRPDDVTHWAADHVTACYRRADPAAMMLDDVIGRQRSRGLPCNSPTSGSCLLPTPCITDSVSGKPPHALSRRRACTSTRSIHTACSVTFQQSYGIL